jgi:hypothetical protein
MHFLQVLSQHLVKQVVAQLVGEDQADLVFVFPKQPVQGPVVVHAAPVIAERLGPALEKGGVAADWVAGRHVPDSDEIPPGIPQLVPQSGCAAP